MHCRDQRHLGLCLGYVPALAYGSCRVSDQGTTLRASDLHNARSTILNPFNNARPLNDDVTAYWRRREFQNYARLHRCRISFHYLAIWRKSCFINVNWCMLKIIHCRLGHTKCLVTHKISSIIILDDVTLWKVMGNHWTCVVHKQRQMSWGLIRLTHPLHLAMRLTPPLVCKYMQQANKHRGINNRTSHSRHFK